MKTQSLKKVREKQAFQGLKNRGKNRGKRKEARKISDMHYYSATKSTGEADAHTIEGRKNYKGSKK
jgi:hypothetical protein